MQESAFIVREFKEGQLPILERVTSLWIVNTGNITAIINGISLPPKQEKTFVVADGTFSKINLQVTYAKEIPKGIIQKRIQLIYKKLL